MPQLASTSAKGTLAAPQDALIALVKLLAQQAARDFARASASSAAVMSNEKVTK
jgi:hypothetical protein